MPVGQYQFETSEIVPFAKCPACRRLIKLQIVNNILITDARNCPFCQTFVEQRDLERSFDDYVKATRALQEAGHLAGLGSALWIIAGIVAGEMLLVYFLKNEAPWFGQLIFGLSVVYMVGGYFNCQNWLTRFGALRVADEELAGAKKNIERLRLYWAIGFIANLCLWVLLMKWL